MLPHCVVVKTRAMGGGLRVTILATDLTQAATKMSPHIRVAEVAWAVAWAVASTVPFA